LPKVKEACRPAAIWKNTASLADIKDAEISVEKKSMVHRRKTFKIE
jgi:hypothetical protein